MPLIKLRKKLISLCTGEIVASITFILCLTSFKYTIGLKINTMLLFPFYILIFILLQGSYYWFYCLRKISNKNINTSWFKRVYKMLRVINFVLLIVCPFVIGYDLIMGNTVGINKETALSIFIYLFSILEYINYFYIRLSYSKFDDIIMMLQLKKVVKSSLAKELSK
jgi:hypothetical protein